MADEENLSNCDQETPVTNKKGKLRQCLTHVAPPSGFCGQILTRGFIVLLCWAVLWSILGQELLPRGNIFGIFNVVVLAALGGFLTRKLSRDTLPPLLGMLVVGFILRNVPGINVARQIDKKWSATLRSMALVVILTRSGLELDPGALRRLKFTVIRLAFFPVHRRGHHSGCCGKTVVGHALALGLSAWVCPWCCHTSCCSSSAVHSATKRFWYRTGNSHFSYGSIII